MMTNRSQSVLEAMASTLGFWSVSFLCTGVGYYLQHAQPPSVADTIVMFAFSLALIPYFFLRERTLEQEFAFDNILRSDNFQVSVLGMVASFAIVFLAILAFATSTNKATCLWALAIGYVPFAYLGLRASLALKKNLERERGFVYRLLLPGISTCLVPIVFGWTIIENDIVPLVLIAVFLIGIGELVRTRKMKLHQLLSVVALTILVCAYFVTKSRRFSLLIVGLIIAFGMGVAETGKRAYLISQRARPLAPNEDKDFYIAGANWASSVFPVLLVLLPLFLLDFPTLPIAVYSGLYVLLWQVMVQDKSSKLAFAVSVFLGFLLPVTVIWSVLMLGGTFFLDEPLQSPNFLAFLTFVAGSLARVFSADRFSNIVRSEAFNNRSYLDGNFVFWLLFVCVVITMFLAGILENFLSFANRANAKTLAIKLSEVNLSLTVIMIVRAFPIWFSGRGPGETPDDHEKKEIESSESLPSIKAFRLVCKLVRPSVSAIPGILVVTAYLISHRGELATALILGIPISLVTMIGFLVNDIFDKEKDTLAGADKPIALGQISMRFAITLGLALTAILWIVELATGTMQTHFVIAASFVGVIGYSHIARANPPLKGFVTALLCISPIVYFCALMNDFVNLWLVVPLFTFIVGRELFMDTVELEGDLRASFKTLAYYLGARLSMKVGWALMICAGVAMFLVLPIISQIITLVALVFLGYAFVNRLDFPEKAIVVTRASMAISSLAVAVAL